MKRGEAYITFRRERFVLHSRRNQKTHSGLYLNEIYVPPADRGKGVAGEMLRSILKLADTHRTTLFLEPREADGPTEKQLVQWYERHGFKRATSNLYMRTPEAPPKHPLADRHRALAEQADPPGSTSRAGAGFRQQRRRKLRSSRHKANPRRQPTSNGSPPNACRRGSTPRGSEWRSRCNSPSGITSRCSATAEREPAQHTGAAGSPRERTPHAKRVHRGYTLDATIRTEFR